MSEPSWLGRVYQNIYDKVAGRHPYQRIWHHQWAAVCDLHKELRHMAPKLTGAVLDVGCGAKPYRHWFAQATDYVGIDIYEDSKADFVIAPNDSFPINDASFDVVISLEVFEHIENLEHTLSEIGRVLKPGGTIIVSIPFLYNEHGAPHDYRRLTKFSAEKIFSGRIELTSLKTLGGIGSTLSIALLNWIEAASNGVKFTRILKGALLPIWVGLSFVVNLLGKGLDWVDKTDAFYHHILILLRKNSEIP